MDHLPMTSPYKYGRGLGEANKSDLIATRRRHLSATLEFYGAEKLLTLQHHLTHLSRSFFLRLSLSFSLYLSVSRTRRGKNVASSPIRLDHAHFDKILRDFTREISFLEILQIFPRINVCISL